jgi:lipid-A-disaccharide synthase
MKKIMMIAGEPSGDMRGAEVIVALKKQLSEISITGIGGEAMRKAGVNTFVDIQELSVMGFLEVIKHLPGIYKIYRLTQQKLREEKPDLLILVDYPGLNLRLARYAKSIGIKTLFYISPQVWAWRQGRVKKIAKSVEHMAVIFPFEKKLYEKEGLPVTFVGHPLTRTIPRTFDKTALRQQFHLKQDSPVLALLPGSRLSELKTLLPIFVASARRIQAQLPSVQIVLALAPHFDETTVKPYLGSLPIKIIAHHTYEVIATSDLVLIASGTATLETALIGTPMIVAYKVSAFTGWVAKHLITIPYISLANIVAEKKVVEEYLQDNARPALIAEKAIEILENPTEQQAIRTALSDIRHKLGSDDAAENMAELIVNLLS